jgi:hypothetical protein
MILILENKTCLVKLSILFIICFSFCHILLNSSWFINVIIKACNSFFKGLKLRVSSKTSQWWFKCLKMVNEIHTLLYYLDICSSCTKHHLLWIHCMSHELYVQTEINGTHYCTSFRLLIQLPTIYSKFIDIINLTGCDSLTSNNQTHDGIMRILEMTVAIYSLDILFQHIHDQDTYNK